jgi:hypothetical protein
VETYCRESRPTPGLGAAKPESDEEKNTPDPYFTKTERHLGADKRRPASFIKVDGENALAEQLAFTAHQAIWRRGTNIVRPIRFRSTAPQKPRRDGDRGGLLGEAFMARAQMCGRTEIFFFPTAFSLSPLPSTPSSPPQSTPRTHTFRHMPAR